MALPALFPILKEAFGVPYIALGLLVSLFYAASGIGQTAAGFLVDRLGDAGCEHELQVLVPGVHVLVEHRHGVCQPDMLAEERARPHQLRLDVKLLFHQAQGRLFRQFVVVERPPHREPFLLFRRVEQEDAVILVIHYVDERHGSEPGHGCRKEGRAFKTIEAAQAGKAQRYSSRVRVAPASGFEAAAPEMIEVLPSVPPWVRLTVM